jgi:hypothetical protein
MNKRFCIIATAIVFLLGAIAASQASAQGGYYGGNYMNVGNPYGYQGYHWPSSQCGGGWGWGGHTWHDTTHFDYYPSRFVPHYDHYHYVPSHYRLHHDGHWHHNHF